METHYDTARFPKRREHLLVKEHVEFLINDARRTADPKIGNDPRTAALGLGRAISDLEAELLRLQAQYEAALPELEAFVVTNAVPGPGNTGVSGRETITYTFNHDVVADDIDWPTTVLVTGDGQGAVAVDGVVEGNLLTVFLDPHLLSTGLEATITLVAIGGVTSRATGMELAEDFVATFITDNP